MDILIQQLQEIAEALNSLEEHPEAGEARYFLSNATNNVCLAIEKLEESL